MLVHASTECDLFSLLGANGLRQRDLGGIALHGRHLAAGGGRTDVDHEDLVLGEFLDLGLFAAIARLDAEQSSEQVVTDLDLRKNVRQLVPEAQHLSDQPIGACEGWVDTGTDADQSPRYGELQVVLLRVETRDLAVDRRTYDLVVLFLHDAGTDLDFVPHAQHALQDGSACHPALQVRYVLSGAVHVEGSDHDEARLRREVPHGQRYLPHEVLAQDVHVVPQYGRDGEYGRRIGHGTRHELAYLFVLRGGGIGLHQIHLVLQDDDVLQAHDLHRRQVFAGLRLRTRFVAGDEQERGVHDGGPVQHGGHEDIVSGTIDEAQVSAQLVLSTPLDEGVLVRRSSGGVDRTGGIIFVLQGLSLIDLGIGVTQFDGDVTLQFVLEAHRLDARNRLDDGRLAVRDVSDCPNIDRSLTGNL